MACEYGVVGSFEPQGYDTRQFFVKADDKGLRASRFAKAHSKGLRGAGSALESMGVRKLVKADLKGLMGEATEFRGSGRTERTLRGSNTG